jgi:hypothetical protein
MRRGVFTLDALPTWCALNDVNFFDVRVQELDVRGYGLVAERNLADEQDNVETPTLVTIPRDLVLSAQAVEEYAKVDRAFRELFEVAGHHVSEDDGA